MISVPSRSILALSLLLSFGRAFGHQGEDPRQKIIGDVTQAFEKARENRPFPPHRYPEKYPGLSIDGSSAMGIEIRSARKFAWLLSEQYGIHLILMTGEKGLGTPGFDGVAVDHEGYPLANFSLKTSARNRSGVLVEIAREAFGKMSYYSQPAAWSRLLIRLTANSRFKHFTQATQKWISALNPSGDRPQWLFLHLTYESINDDVPEALAALTLDNERKIIAIHRDTVFYFENGKVIQGELNPCERALAL